MRRLLMGCVAATTALLAGLAWAGNQETADQIAANLKQSGKLSDYRIAVKYLDGTVWLEGRVRDEKQKATALDVVKKTPGVTVTKVFDDNLAIASGEKTEALKPIASKPTPAPRKSPNAANPLRGSLTQPLSASFTTGSAQRAVANEPASLRTAGARGAVPTALMQAEPADKVQPPVPGAAPAPPPPAAESPAPGTMPMTNGAPLPMYATGVGTAPAPVRYDQPAMPNYAWPSYAAYPNYAALTYPKQYSPTAWPYIGPFYPYPQVPLGWRKVTLQWSDGWWFLDFKDEPKCCWWR
jgi:hypothetical protein